MMKRFKLSASILKTNRLYSGALILIYTLVVSLLVMLCFFPKSVDNTFYGFLQDYHLADGYLVTSLTSNQMAAEMEENDGVEKVCTSLMLDCNTTLSNGQSFALRYISVDEDTLLSLYNIETQDKEEYNKDLVAVSSGFAKGNGLSVGDSIAVNDQTLTITAIVSSPETIAVARDGSCWYETNSFGYIYVSEEIMNEISGCNGFCNQFQIYFKEGTDQQKTMDELEELEGLNVLSSTLFEGSSVDKQIKAGIDGTKAVVSYLPMLIVLIGLLFSALFLSQIIGNSDQRIALLKVLGYSSKEVSLIFILYSLSLTLISTVLGLGLGYWMLKMMLSIYQGVYDLPQVTINGNLTTLIIIIVSIQLLGVLSCLLCSISIASMDPMRIGKEVDLNEKPMPSFMNRLSRDSFNKITLTTIYRNRKRLIMSVLCSVACFALSFVALSLLITINQGMDKLFADRLGFDVTVYGNSEALSEIEQLDSVETAERKTSFYLEYEDEVMRIETLVDNSTLTNIYDTDYQTIQLKAGEIALEEGFARRHSLNVGDSIEIEEETFTVSALVREYLYPVMYIVEDDAAELGYDSANTLAVQLKENISMIDFSNELIEIDGFEYYIDNHSREENVRSTLESLNIPCLLFVGFALLTGLTIIANMNRMSIKEREREYATLLVLGVDRWRFFKMSMTEALVQFVFSCLIGLPLSIPITQFMMKNMSSISQEYVLENPLMVGVITIVLIFIYILSGVFITNKSIQKMNVLKVLADRS